MRFVKTLHEVEGLDRAVKIAQHKQKELDKILKGDQEELAEGGSAVQ